jgi:hypothetical protein
VFILPLLFLFLFAFVFAFAIPKNELLAPELFFLDPFPIGSRLFIPGIEFSVVVAAELIALPRVVVVLLIAPMAEFAAEAMVDVLFVAIV